MSGDEAAASESYDCDVCGGMHDREGMERLNVVYRAGVVAGAKALAARARRNGGDGDGRECVQDESIALQRSSWHRVAQWLEAMAAVVR